MLLPVNQSKGNFMNSPLPRESVSWGKLVDDLRTLIGDAEGLLKSLGGDMSEQAKATRASLSKQLESARVTYGQLQDKAVEQARVADRAIRTHPYQTLGVAFGLGLVVGLLATRNLD
jgi:ElaB/YqjD/DUF883 family membrane-anchored ribosome-binding protein